MDPLTILTALLPIAQDGIRAVINKFTGGAGAQPANADEWIRVMEAQTKRLEALQKLDSPTGTVSMWVNNIRALMRPTAALLVLMGYWYTLIYDTDIGMATNAANLAASVVFYLFGDRTVMYMKGMAQ